MHSPYVVDLCFEFISALCECGISRIARFFLAYSYSPSTFTDHSFD